MRAKIYFADKPALSIVPTAGNHASATQQHKNMNTENNPALKALRNHVTGAIARGEAHAIVEKRLTKKEQEKQEQLDNLRQWFPKGSTVYTMLRRVSASGMSRDISVVCIHPDEAGTGTRWISHSNYAVSKVLGYRLVTKNGSDAIRVSGCGMDMGHHIVHSLAHALYDDGCALSHQWL